MAKEILLTKAGYEELVKKYEDLTTHKRHEIAEKIKVAREFGDLSENAEYEEAKTEQAFIEGEIMELEHKLRNAVIIDETGAPKGVVAAGSKVKVLDKEYNEECVYTIVGSDEVDLVAGRISNESPIGSALLGSKVGQEVVVNAPAGEMIFKVLEIN